MSRMVSCQLPVADFEAKTLQQNFTEFYVGKPIRSNIFANLGSSRIESGTQCS